MSYTPSGRPAACRAWPFLLLGLSLLPLASCKGRRYDPVPLYPTRGQVLFKGRPAAGAEVRLHPLGPVDPTSLFPAAKVEADGSFQLTTYENKDGAPAGEYAVTIRWDETTGREGELVDRLKGRYSDPKKSPWQVQVQKGPNELEPFHVQ